MIPAVLFRSSDAETEVPPNTGDYTVPNNWGLYFFVLGLSAES